MPNFSGLFSAVVDQRNCYSLICAGAKETPLVVSKTVEKRFSRKTLLLSSAIAGLFMQPTASLAGLEYVTHWDHYDTSGANALFNGPSDVAFLKSNGNMAIVDSNAGVTQGGEVVIQQTDGTFVTKVAALNDQGPVRAATDPNSGDVYIGTYYESTVRRFTEAGGALTLADTWTGCTANGGFGPYTWGKTFGVAVDSTGALYVSDYDNLRIIKMNSAGQCLAAPLTTYTKNGTPGQVFLNLTGLAVDSADNLWAADYGKKVIVKYDSAGTWQTTLTGFTNCGTTTAFGSPKDIDIDPATNNLFVTDTTYGIIKLDSSGNFLTKTIKYNTNTSLSVAFGSGYSSGFIYATDYGHSAVVKYSDPNRKVSVTASANGTVAADVGGNIAGTTGGNTCVDQFVDNTSVVLTATPSGGYGVTWGGADGSGCSGTTCTLSNIGADKVVSATFFSLTPSVASSDPAGSPAASDTSMSFTVVFSEAVSGVDASDFTLTATGTAAGTIGTPTTADNITWTVPITGISGAGNLRLDLNSSGTDIAATAAGNTAIGGGFTGGSTHSANVPPVVNAVCGTVAATSFQPTNGLCSFGTLNAAGVVIGASSWTWACDGSGGGTSTTANACSASFGLTAPNSGGAAAQLTGGTWVFSASGTAANQTAGFIATTGHVKSPPSLPPGYTFPHGLFDFVLEGGVNGSTATITITYPTAIPANSVYWKYGPSPAGYNCSGAACETAHWYQMPPAQAVIAGNTITLSITDGGVGDDDLAENGTIVDQGGPGVPVAATSIPTLSEWGMIILSSLMAMFGYVQMRQRKGPVT